MPRQWLVQSATERLAAGGASAHVLQQAALPTQSPHVKAARSTVQGGPHGARFAAGAAEQHGVLPSAAHIVAAVDTALAHAAEAQAPWFWQGAVPARRTVNIDLEAAELLLSKASPQSSSVRADTQGAARCRGSKRRPTGVGSDTGAESALATSTPSSADVAAWACSPLQCSDGGFQAAALHCIRPTQGGAFRAQSEADQQCRTVREPVSTHVLRHRSWTAIEASLCELQQGCSGEVRSSASRLDRCAGSCAVRLFAPLDAGCVLRKRPWQHEHQQHRAHGPPAEQECTPSPGNAVQAGGRDGAAAYGRSGAELHAGAAQLQETVLRSLRQPAAKWAGVVQHSRCRRFQGADACARIAAAFAWDASFGVRPSGVPDAQLLCALRHICNRLAVLLQQLMPDASRGWGCAGEQQRPEAFSALPIVCCHAAGPIADRPRLVASDNTLSCARSLGEEGEARARRFGASFAQDVQPGAYHADKDPVLQVCCTPAPTAWLGGHLPVAWH